ncbi:MAG: response regulator [Chloroflexota bacterium]
MTKPRLLIVEDNEDIAEMLQFYFSSHGYEVLVAHEGEAALNICRAELPSLVLLDVGLPDIDGFTVCRRLRQSTRFQHLPVIFATKRDRRADKAEGLALGADDFVAKPFDLEDLFLRVQNTISRSARNNLTDPRTGLPGLEVVRQETARAADQPDRRIITFQLRRLEPFRELYSAIAATDLLRAAALLLNNVLEELGQSEAFLGQAAEDSFTVICAADRATTVACAAVKRFAETAHKHYSFGEREGDNVRARDANQQERVVPIVTLESNPPCPN